VEKKNLILMAKTRPGVAFSSKIKLGKKDIKIVRCKFYVHFVYN